MPEDVGQEDADRQKKKRDKVRKSLKSTEMKSDLLNTLTWKNLRSWKDFVAIMNAPRDPSSLGAVRIIFGECFILLESNFCVSM